MTTIECKTVRSGEYPHTLTVRTHTFSADLSAESGGADSAPGPHDYFDGSVAACKALTAMWYAKRHAIPLERVDCRLESDNSQERAGIYKIRVYITFVGTLSDEQRAALYRAADKCPITKLVTTSDVQIETISS